MKHVLIVIVLFTVPLHPLFDPSSDGLALLVALSQVLELLLLELIGVRCSPLLLLLLGKPEVRVVLADFQGEQANDVRSLNLGDYSIVDKERGAQVVSWKAEGGREAVCGGGGDQVLSQEVVVHCEIGVVSQVLELKGEVKDSVL